MQQETGLQAQVLACKQYCERHGITDYLIFQDEGISGAKTSRPQLNEMIKLARENQLSSIITYSFSRFGRSTIHLISSLEEFNKLGISFVSVSEHLETHTAIGKIIFQILSSLAEFEREQIRSRVKTGIENAKAKGKKLGQPKIRNSVLIQELRKQGLSFRKIAKLANCSIGTVANELRSTKAS
jgi:DNA invertase Pin-like site-specific DNA recombinase